ncbi:MAG: S1C family serine protease [Anaerolineales bacterium]
MANVVEGISKELAGIVEAAGPTVVRVEGRRRLPASGIVWFEEGIVVTAHHVVERDDRLGVGFADDKQFEAELVGRDPTTDLAVLRVEGVELSPAASAALDDLSTGHLVLALGRPGRTVQATLGIVSALGTSWRTAAGGTIDRYLQTDVVMYPGFSGGPLMNAEGEVLGLNTSALRAVSLSIPSVTIDRVVESILSHGRVQRGYLGVGVQPVKLPEALAEELGQETGLILISVEPGSPAEAGRLTLGDTLLSLRGDPVLRLDDLLSLLRSELVGEEVIVRILRGGGVREQKVTVGER